MIFSLFFLPKKSFAQNCLNYNKTINNYGMTIKDGFIEKKVINKMAITYTLLTIKFYTYETDRF